MGVRKLVLIALAAIWGALSAPSYAQTAGPAPAAAPAAPASASADDNYVLGANDVIEVSVLGRSDFTTRGRISADGTIQLPYLGSVTAAKKTTRELSDDLKRALEAGAFFAHPIVKVDVVSYASRYATVLGEATTPGLVPIDRAYRLSEIIARAGGVRADAADYVILRPAEGPEKRLSMKALATGDASDDPFVQPGDKIFVPPADQFYISGEVKAPGAYTMLDDMTLRMAIARGGGLTDSGNEHRIQVTRRGVKISHPDLDSKVEPGDVIVAGQSIF